MSLKNKLMLPAAIVASGAVGAGGASLLSCISATAATNTSDGSTGSAAQRDPFFEAIKLRHRWLEHADSVAFGVFDRDP
jgi:hypothetical protein